MIDITEPPPEEEIGVNDGEDVDEEGGDEQDSRNESESITISNLSSLNMDMGELGELDDLEDGYIEEGGSQNDDTEPDVHK